MRNFNAFETCNVQFLVNKQVEYATIQVTETGLRKSILDATAPVRAYFLEKGIHNYESQLQGEGNKRMIETCILTSSAIYKTQSSLYRPMTKKGDPRIWIYGIKQFINADDIFALISHNHLLYVINLSYTDIPAACNSSIENPIKDLVNEIHGLSTSVSNELLGLIRDRMSNWIPTTVLADTGVGREVERQLGISMNAAKTPDYKGIELKTKRVKSNTSDTLFTNDPNWNLSKCKSGKEIADRYGYLRPGLSYKTLQVTVNSLRPNRQGLKLNINWDKNCLEMNHYYNTSMNDVFFRKMNDVAVWTLLHLHERLIEKHHETFWIDAETRTNNSIEEFRVIRIEHTKNPIASQFDVLLEQGNIKLDIMLSRPSGRGNTFSFKMGRKYRPMLFPESVTYQINA